MTRFIMSCLLTVSCLMLTSCESPPTLDRPPMPDETLADIRSTHSPADGQVYELPGDAAIAPDAAAEARVTTVLLPLDKGVDRAWKIVDEQTIPLLTRGVWHANGLRIGLLSRHDLENFLETLPENWDDRQQRIIGGPTPTPLLVSRPLRANFYADLTVPPFAPKREGLHGHRLQLLMTMRPQAGGFARVELTPHHHKPRQMLRARTAQEKMLDGRLFEELTVGVTVPDDRYLVLGLARDPSTLPAEERLENQQPAEPPAEQAVARNQPGGPPDLVLQARNEPGDLPPPAANPRMAQIPPAPLPLNLGRALMTQAMPGGEAQVVLLIKLRPLR